MEQTAKLEKLLEACKEKGVIFLRGYHQYHVVHQGEIFASFGYIDDDIRFVGHWTRMAED